MNTLPRDQILNVTDLSILALYQQEMVLFYYDSEREMRAAYAGELCLRHIGEDVDRELVLAVEHFLMHNDPVMHDLINSDLERNMENE